MIQHRITMTIVSMLLVASGIGTVMLASDASARTVRAVAVKPFAEVGGFTPALADPRLAAMVGKAPLGGRDYDFTPAQARRLVTMARVVTALPAKSPAPDGAVSVVPSVKIAAIEYNLGASGEWKQFAPIGRGVQAPASIGVRTSFDLATTAGASRLPPMVERSVATALPPGKEPVQPLLDSTNAFRLTRNVDLTAGNRAGNDAFRLQRTGDDRRDSQAVYIGTALRF